LKLQKETTDIPGVKLEYVHVDLLSTKPAQNFAEMIRTLSSGEPLNRDDDFAAKLLHSAKTLQCSARTDFPYGG
jgi:hypothetical protein